MKQVATQLPTIHVVSDSMGITARTLTRAATSQFGDPNPNIDLLPDVKCFEDARAFIEDRQQAHAQLYGNERFLLFYTLVESDLKRELKDYIANTRISWQST